MSKVNYLVTKVDKNGFAEVLHCSEDAQAAFEFYNEDKAYTERLKLSIVQGNKEVQKFEGEYESKDNLALLTYGVKNSLDELRWANDRLGYLQDAPDLEKRAAEKKAEKLSKLKESFSKVEVELQKIQETIKENEKQIQQYHDSLEVKKALNEQSVDLINEDAKTIDFSGFNTIIINKEGVAFSNPETTILNEEQTKQLLDAIDLIKDKGLLHNTVVNVTVDSSSKFDADKMLQRIKEGLTKRGYTY